MKKKIAKAKLIIENKDYMTKSLPQITERERLLLEDKELFAKVIQGLKESKEGKVVRGNDFTQYIEDTNEV